MKALLPAFVIGLLGAALAGCESVQQALAGMERPSASFRSVRIDQLGADAVTLAVEVDVANPYGVALPLTGGQYRLAAYGQPLVDGTLRTPGRIPAGESRTLTVRPRVGYAEAIRALSQVRPGSVLPYDLEVEVRTDSSVANAAIPTLRTEGELPLPAVPRIGVSGVAIDRLSVSEVAATATLNVANANDFRVGLQALDYALSLGGIQVAEASLREALDLPEGASGELTLPLRFSPMRAGMAVYNLLQGERAGYRIAGDANLTTPFGDVTLPYDSSGKTPLRR